MKNYQQLERNVQQYLSELSGTSVTFLIFVLFGFTSQNSGWNEVSTSGINSTLKRQQSIKWSTFQHLTSGVLFLMDLFLSWNIGKFVLEANEKTVCFFFSCSSWEVNKTHLNDKPRTVKNKKMKFFLSSYSWAAFKNDSQNLQFLKIIRLCFWQIWGYFQAFVVLTRAVFLSIK